MAVCPFMDPNADPVALRARQEPVPELTSNGDFINQFVADDTGTTLTTNTGGQVEDQASLKAGARGPTMLEDFVLREKIMVRSFLSFDTHLCTNIKFWRL